MIKHLCSRYNAAIFDLDGTLADSMHAWDHICRDWLHAKGIDAEADLEAIIEKMTITQAAQFVIEKYGIAGSVKQIHGEWEAMVLHKYEKTIALKEGAAELVKTLAASGIKLAIATSCFPSACEAILCRYGIRNLFKVIVYSDEVGRDKSFPDIYLACANRLEVKPESCIVFEDLASALTGVRAAGMGLAAVYDESAKEHWETFKNNADYAILSFREFNNRE